MILKGFSAEMDKKFNILNRGAINTAVDCFVGAGKSKPCWIDPGTDIDNTPQIYLQPVSPQDHMTQESNIF